MAKLAESKKQLWFASIEKGVGNMSKLTADIILDKKSQTLVSIQKSDGVGPEIEKVIKGFTS